MKTWTVGKRIVVGFGTVILATIALGLFACWHLAEIRRDANNISGNSLPGLLQISQVQALALQNYCATLRVILAADEAGAAVELEEIKKNVASINMLTNQFALTLTGKRERELFDAMIQARARYVPAFREVCTLQANQQTQEAVNAVRTRMNPASAEFLNAISALYAVKQENAKGSTGRIATPSAALSPVSPSVLAPE